MLGLDGVEVALAALLLVASPGAVLVLHLLGALLPPRATLGAPR